MNIEYEHWINQLFVNIYCMESLRYTYIFYSILSEGSKNFKNNSKQRSKADLYYEYERITKTRHDTTFCQSKILFWVSKITNEMTMVISCTHCFFNNYDWANSNYFKNSFQYGFLWIPSKPEKQNWKVLFLLIFIIVKKRV